MVTVTYELDYLFLQLYGPHVHRVPTWRIVFKLWLRYFLLRSSSRCCCCPWIWLILHSRKQCPFCCRRHRILLFVMNINKQETISEASLRLFKSEINDDKVLWLYGSMTGANQIALTAHNFIVQLAGDYIYIYILCISLKLMSLRDIILERKYKYICTYVQPYSGSISQQQKYFWQFSIILMKLQLIERYSESNLRLF